MPKLLTPDGEIDGDEVQRKFDAAMAAPEPDEPPAPAPARVGDGEGQAAAAAPSTGDDGKHTKSRTTSRTSGGASRGRGAKRATSKAAPAAAAPSRGAYVQPVSEFLQGVTLAAVMMPVPAGPLGTRVRLQGQLINDHAAGLATAIDAAACNNSVIRRGVEQLTMGSAGWVLPAVMAVVPFAAATNALWRAPVTEEMAAAAEEFAGAVRAELQEMARAAAGASPTA